jgi:hypothetical protein
MASASIKDSLISQLDKLPYELQLRVLDIVKALIPKGVEGKNLLRFEGTIPADDLPCFHAILKQLRDTGI